MPITGEMLIGALSVGPTQGVMRALRPAANPEIESDFAWAARRKSIELSSSPITPPTHSVTRTLRNALHSWCGSRAGLDAITAPLAHRMSLETGLPVPQLEAEATKSGDSAPANLPRSSAGKPVLRTTIDPAEPDRQPREA
jgi:alpha-ketoglutaric semialdehyde dehydrogenase